jgi:hypothetical protein
MITKRPEDMTQEEYRLILKEQQRRLKEYKKTGPPQTKTLIKSSGKS